MTSSGWYHAEGDPVGTTRFWDGERWVGDPQYSGVSPSDSGGTAALNLASTGARLGARAIDIAIAFVILVILLGSAIGDFVDGYDLLGPDPTQTEIQDLVDDIIEDNAARIGVFVLLGIAWDFLWVAIFGGTPGKLMLGLRVGRADTGASPPGWGKSALRALNRIVALIPIVGFFIWLLAGIASLIMLFTDDQHRTVMDRVASTVVVRK